MDESLTLRSWRGGLRSTGSYAEAHPNIPPREIWKQRPANAMA
jgi:hypothetical protein